MSNPTATLGLTKPRYGTEPIIAKDLDLIDAAIAADRVSIAGLSGGGSGFSQVKLTFHDTDILNMQQDGSGGVILLPGVANKYYIPQFCILKFHYGGVAFFTGTVFDDLVLYQGAGIWMTGSTKFLIDGSSTPDIIEMLHFRDQPTQAFLADAAGGLAVYLANADTPLADGDPGGNTNSLIVTLGYLTYDTVTGVVS